MGLPKSIANIFAALNIKTAKDALSLTEFELMELLDVGLTEVASAASLSNCENPRRILALFLMEQRLQNEQFSGHLPTRLKGLNNALFGGIPFGVLTELVGPAGIGKTQDEFNDALLQFLALSEDVIVGFTPSKLWRIMEIGATSYPEMFQNGTMAGKILVLQPASLSEFTEFATNQSSAPTTTSGVAGY